MKILTSGCSLTDYKWPTWANYLKLWGHTVRNVGDGGIDNSIIVHRTTDYLLEHNDIDAVCILWTGYDRYIPKWRHIITHEDKGYIKRYYDKQERLRSFTKNIDYINLFCAERRIPLYNFFYSNLSDKEIQFITNRMSSDYHLNFIPSLKTHSKNKLHKIKIDDTTVYDPHPLPIQHWQFCNDVVIPVLNPEAELVSETPAIVQDHNLQAKAGNFVECSKYSFLDRPESLHSSIDKNPYNGQ